MYLSRFLENAVNEFSKLPGVGKKTAFRFALHLMEQQHEDAQKLAKSLLELHLNCRTCTQCGVPNDKDLCDICANPLRKQNQICVVASLKDLLAIEHTEQYSGLYHVLGGVISPIDGIGPQDLNIDLLEKRLRTLESAELIMALNPTIEGDTTIYYLSKRFEQYNIKLTMISRGISVGAELDYTDSLTLIRSIENRQPYQNLIAQ